LALGAIARVEVKERQCPQHFSDQIS
jgi:hypothetical protein